MTTKSRARALVALVYFCAIAPAFAHQKLQPEPDEPVPPAVVEVAESDAPGPLAWLGNFHPTATHFPVALLLSAALAELLYLRRADTSFAHATRFCVRVGAAGALVAGPLGWFAAGFALDQDAWLTAAYRWAGTTTALWALVVLRLGKGAGPGGATRRPFRIALFVGAALVGATGFLGGALVHGLDYYSW